MSGISPSDPLLTLISPADVIQYLTRMQWRSIPCANDFAALFGGPLVPIGTG